jgi:hypothetical protein
MPFFLAPLVPGLIAWGGRALATYGLARLFSDSSIQELEDMLMGWVVRWVADKSGLVLDESDPLSDASLAGAVGQKVGIPFRSFKDQAMIREDLDSYAVGLIESKSGYNVRSIQNVVLLKEDFLRIGAAELSARLGLPAGVMPAPGAQFDPVDIRAQLLTWAKAELMTEINEQVAVKVEDVLAAADLEGTAAELNTRLVALGSVENVTARQLAVRMANEMATQAIVDYQRVAVGASKRSRRQESLRAAQAKFRAAHGNRQVYVPLGMNANVS